MDTPQLIIGGLAPWFGGKRTMAPAVIAELGKHELYFEPFCGSMAVLLAKEPSQREIVNDLHGDLTNLAFVVQDENAAGDLCERLARVVFADAMIDAAAEHLSATSVPDPPQFSVDRAFWYFVSSWIMRNGIAGTNIGEKRGAGYALALRWTKGGGSPIVRLRNAIASIPAWHARLQRVQILRRDGIALLDRVEDQPGTAIYVDSPYLPESRSGFTGSGGHSRYKHEFADADHVRLAEKLRGFKQARIVVSLYDCETARSLYGGWTFADHTRQKHLHAQAGRGARAKTAPEVLIINGPSLVAPSGPRSLFSEGRS